MNSKTFWQFVVPIVLWATIVLCLQAIMLDNQLHRKQVIIKPSYPTDSESKIVHHSDGKDYMHAWWLWGPYAKGERLYNYSAEELRDIANN